MIEVHEMTREERAEQVREIDAQIFRIAAEGAALIERRASVGQINAECEFLRTLFRRRDIIINEAKKAGLTERDLYKYDNK